MSTRRPSRSRPRCPTSSNPLETSRNHRDMSEFAPKATLCSSVWVWDRFLVPLYKNVSGGDWKTKPYGEFVGLKHGGTDIACCNKIVPKKVVAKVMAARQKIIDGWHVYTGPIQDNTGKTVIPAGKTPRSRARSTIPPRRFPRTAICAPAAPSTPRPSGASVLPAAIPMTRSIWRPIAGKRSPRKSGPILPRRRPRRVSERPRARRRLHSGRGQKMGSEWI